MPLFPDRKSVYELFNHEFVDKSRLCSRFLIGNQSTYELIKHEFVLQKSSLLSFSYFNLVYEVSEVAVSGDFLSFLWTKFVFALVS